MISHAGDSNIVQFTQLAGTEQQYTNPSNLVPLANLTKDDVHRAAGNVSEFRLIWINLPEADFGSRAAGVVVLRPRTLRSIPQEIASCVFNAGWGTSTTTEINEDNIGEALAFPVNQPSAVLQFEDNTSEGVYGFNETFTDIFTNVSGSTYPQRPLEMPLTWLSYLNPIVNLQSDTNTTQRLYDGASGWSQ